MLRWCGQAMKNQVGAAPDVVENKPALAPRITLITGTAGRTAELARLAASLTAQTVRDFEWIVVDQNADDRVAGILEQHAREASMRRIRAAPGLSAALNLGVREAGGSIVGFPDDDGWFATDTIARILALFDRNAAWDGIACRAVDEAGVPSIINWSSRAGPCTRYNAWFRAVSTGLFFRRNVFDRIGGFDETLGVGPGLLLAAHDSDFVLRAVGADFHVEYVVEPVVYHPQVARGTDADSVRKARFYAIGAGRLMRDHRMPMWWTSAAVGVPLARSVASLVRGERDAARLNWAESEGRFVGWLGAGGGRRTVASWLGGLCSSLFGAW